jgi:uncharacterized membrane protein YdjX (TVP38/TMEM64 family)
MKGNKLRKLMTIAHLTIVVGVLVAVAVYYFSKYDRVSREYVTAFVEGFGPWGPLAYAVIYVACAPIPFLAPLFSAVGGLLFGAVRGTLYILVIAAVSALVPFSLSRRLGRDWVEAKLKGKKLDEIYQQSEGSKGFTFVLLMRLIPILPWEVQNYVGGLTKVSVPTFIFATMLGIIPGSFSLAFLGAAATDPSSWQFYAAITLKIVTALIPVVAVAIRSRRNRQEVSTA